MNRLLNRLTNLVLLVLGIFSLVSLMVDSFGCRVAPSFWIWLLLACVLLWYAGTFKRGIWIGMPLCALLLYGAYRFFGRDPWPEAQDLIDRISGAFYSHITHPGSAYPYANYTQAHSLVFLLVAFFLAAYLISALTSRNLRISLSMLETLPIFICCIIVNGSVPALASAGILLFWFLLVATGPGYNPDGSAGRTLLCCILPIALVLGGLLLLHRPENYVYTEYDLKLSQRFERYTHWFDLLTGRSSEADVYLSDPEHQAESDQPRTRYHSAWDAEDSSMQLSQEYDHESALIPLFELRSDTGGKLYLRTKCYGDYRGTGWLPAEELSAGSSLPFTAFAVSQSPEGVSRSVEVRTMVDFDTLCIPYYAAVSSGSDVFVASEDQINYKISYTEYHGLFEGLTLPGDAASSEQVYQLHAHNAYVRLPEETRAAALAICAEAGLRAEDPDIITAVASYVQQLGEYDLDVGAYPSDDYAIYFLTQSHRGYCIHYASAATVLYRALGIPARVTEGFVAVTYPGIPTDVLAQDAHAWVEVYLDGVGWVPVEVTHGSGFATLEMPAAPDPTPEPSPELLLPESGTMPELSTPQPTPGDNGGGGGSSGPEEAGGGAGEDGGSLNWKALLILPCLALALILWYLLARLLFESQVNQADGRKAVLACWRYANRASRFGGELPQIIVDTAEKVAFSPHMIRKDELTQCRLALKDLIEQVYPGLNPFNKFRFRILRGMK